MNARNANPPQLFFFDGCALFLGTVADNSAHAHYAVQIGVACDGDFALEYEVGRRAFACAVVPSNVPHRLLAGDGGVLLLFVDPTTDVGRQIAHRFAPDDIHAFADRGLADLRARARAALTATCDAKEADDLRATLVRMLCGEQSIGPRFDARVTKVLALLGGPKGESCSLATLAHHVQLSSSRLRHLFRQQVGLSVRGYKLWLRLRRAAEHLGHSGSVTEAAYAAGFADSAHLSRSFRRMFGVVPSWLGA